MDGAISSCLRVGDLAPGSYHVVLEQIVPKHAALAAPARAAGPPLTLQLTPASGPPGTTVALTGTLAEASSSQPTFASACWDGCRDGLQYSGVALHWRSPTTFTTTIVVPEAPWVETSPLQVLAPRTGTYRIGLESVGAQQGCGLGGGEGSAPFHLEVASSPASWCSTQASCASLVATPDHVLPGRVVKVTGDAPLVSVIGSAAPFAFQLEVLSGRGSGLEIRFHTMAKTGAIEVNFGHGALTIRKPPPLRAQPRTVPIAEAADGLTPIAAEAGRPPVVAWCDGSHVTVDGPNGRAVVALSGASAVLEQLGFTLFGSSTPRCVAVAPLADPRGGVPAIAVGFVVAPHGEALPAADVALVSTNGGRPWSPVPAPPGTSLASFGGFRHVGTTTDALFVASSSSAQSAPGASETPLVEATDDGGAHWHSAAFSCPAAEPCVAFRAYPWGNCAMNGTSQVLLRSSDGGRSWRSPRWPGAVQACTSATVAAPSASTELLIDSGSRYLARLSTDAGAHWEVLGVPALPGAPRGSGVDPGDGGVVLLPDGALLAWRSGGDPTRLSWDLLTPGAKRWCSATGAVGTSTDSSMPASSWPVVLSDQLWWQTLTSSPGGLASTSVATHHEALSAIRC